MLVEIWRLLILKLHRNNVNATFVASWSCRMLILAVIPGCWICCGLFWVFSATWMISIPTRAWAVGHLLVALLNWCSRFLFFIFYFCERRPHLQAFLLMRSFQYAVHNGEEFSLPCPGCQQKTRSPEPFCKMLSIDSIVSEGYCFETF